MLSFLATLWLPRKINRAENQMINSSIQYPKGDLNPHSRNGQRILSPSCLPFHHSSFLRKPVCVPARKSVVRPRLYTGFGVRCAHNGVFTWRGNLFSGAKIALIREKTTVCFCEFCFRRLFPPAHTAGRALLSLDGQCVLHLLQKN